MQFLIIFIFVILAMLFMVIILYFNTRRKRKAGCCRHGLEEGTKVSPQSCPICSTYIHTLKYKEGKGGDI
jgi:hypothetical protein